MCGYIPIQLIFTVDRTVWFDVTYNVSLISKVNKVGIKVVVILRQSPIDTWFLKKEKCLADITLKAF